MIDPARSVSAVDQGGQVGGEVPGEVGGVEPRQPRHNLATTPTLLLAEAERATGLSRSSLRRLLDSGALPNAWRDPDGLQMWHIPVTDLVAAGCELSAVDLREQVGGEVQPRHDLARGEVGKSDKENWLDMSALNEMAVRVARAEGESEKWRAIAEERGERIGELHTMMRMLNPAPAGVLTVESTRMSRWMYVAIAVMAVAVAAAAVLALR